MEQGAAQTIVDLHAANGIALLSVQLCKALVSIATSHTCVVLLNPIHPSTFKLWPLAICWIGCRMLADIGLPNIGNNL